MQEGTGDQIARLGTITRARVSGKELSIECTYELDIPSLLNSTIYANKTEFDMPHEFEFSRTHWAVKDVGRLSRAAPQLPATAACMRIP